MGVNLLMSGENAVSIALAARDLPGPQRQRAIWLGALFAVILRVVLTFVAVELLALPYVQLVGGLALIWIGVQLMNDENDEVAHHHPVHHLWGAVRIILIADLVMSLDNVIAVAAAAKGSPLLLILGLVTSAPIVVLGSAMLIKIMARYPMIITLGAALIGWVAGETICNDGALSAILAEWQLLLPEHIALTTLISATCSVLVVVLGLTKQSKTDISEKKL